jgi:hypothetical protein
VGFFVSDPHASLTSSSQAVDLLDAAVAGNAASCKTIGSVVAVLPNNLTRERKPPPVIPKEERKPHILDCLPPESKALAVRPRPKVSGIRKIPILANATGIPFLRFTKPQPRNLSRIIRQKLEAKNKRFHDKVLLSHYHIPLGQQEDAWDDLVREYAEVGRREPRWIDEPRKALEEVLRKTEDVKAGATRLADKMQHIVEQETELARREELQRAAEKEARHGSSSKVVRVPL